MIFQDKKAFLFDLDGTLVDSMWIWKKIDIEYLGRFGLELPDNLQASIEGMSFSETALYFKERFSIPDSLEEMKADWNRMAWEKYTREVPLKPGVRDFLTYYRARGVKMAVATSNSQELAEAVLAAHGLTDFFDTVVTGCEVAHGKPWPDIYLEAAARLGVNAGECLVFEDVVAGIQAGKSAGMKVAAVEDAYSLYQKLQKRELADYYITDYNLLLTEEDGGAYNVE
ncbi:MAG: HAD family phosphatase [Lachnospiraceae bacterium]|nr:HAD family phosphatase [Lachnospiraceae bacterium]